MKKGIQDKYLPLGTICLLKGGTKKLMITGFCMYDNEHGHILYDYCGCLYPEGMLSNKEAILFNHEDIDEVTHMGLSDEDDKQFKINLTSMIQVIETLNTPSVDNVINIDDEEAEEE